VNAEHRFGGVGGREGQGTSMGAQGEGRKKSGPDDRRAQKKKSSVLGKGKGKITHGKKKNPGGGNRPTILPVHLPSNQKKTW